MIMSGRRLGKKFLEDRYNAVIFKKGEARGVYIVGGYVRDTLKGISSRDRDFVIRGDLRSFVDELKGILGGTVIKFRRRDMVRLAFRSGITLDFSSLVGTMQEDLEKRDFTVNAIAWSNETGLVDMHGGLADLEKKRIRVISEANLRADPLRILRAYRFAAEFGGSVEKKTRDAIKALRISMEKVSRERITLELFQLLNSKRSSRYLREALSDGVMSEILLIPYKALERNIRAVSKLESGVLEGLPRGVKVILKTVFSQNLTHKGLFCLEPLLRGTVPGDHRLRMSSTIIKRVRLAWDCFSGLERTNAQSRDKLFDLFMRSKDASLDAIIIAGRLELLREYTRFKKVVTDGFLESREIIEIAGIESGPLAGRIISALKRAQFQGAVKSKREAVIFVKNYGK